MPRHPLSIMQSVACCLGLGVTGFVIADPWSIDYQARVVDHAEYETLAGTGLRTREDRSLIHFAQRDWGKVSLQFGFDWTFTRYVFSGVQGRNRDLHQVHLPIQFSTSNGDWRLSGVLRPGVSTASYVLRQLPSEGTSSDFNLTGQASLTRQLFRNMAIQLGFASDRRLGASKTYPTGGVLLQRGAWNWRLLLPEPQVAFQYDEWHRFFARVFPDGNSWYVKNRFTGGESVFYHKAWRAELGWDFQFHPRFGAGLNIGYEFDRRQGFDDDMDIRRNSNVEGTGYLELTLRFRKAGTSREMHR